LVL
ncbi:single-stranded DNA-binding family protein, partial [Vibrio cholerae HC-17A1]|jgi:large subunit ribosomal protein LP1